jgi:O-methyltransferase
VVRFHPDDDPTGRRNAYQLPPGIKTMIGQRRLHHLRGCVEDVIANKVKGDLIETGVWRGGATILMRGVLKAYGETGRTVVVADSFQGLPPPDAERYPADAGLDFSTHDVLAVSKEQVQENFRTFGLLDDQVEFVQGWFRDTMPGLRDRTWSVLRLDGDLYESTTDALTALEPKVSPGGFVIVDDYGGWESCRAAVDDYRAGHGIEAPLHQVDWTGVWWRTPMAG